MSFVFIFFSLHCKPVELLEVGLLGFISGVDDLWQMLLDYHSFILPL